MQLWIGRRAQGGGEVKGLQMKYFVLKPKGDGPYAEASRCAIYAYAQSIENENPELSRDLIEWWDRERKAVLTVAKEDTP